VWKTSRRRQGKRKKSLPVPLRRRLQERRLEMFSNVFHFPSMIFAMLLWGRGFEACGMYCLWSLSSEWTQSKVKLLLKVPLWLVQIKHIYI
jgi:hypothetical protein